MCGLRVFRAGGKGLKATCRPAEVRSWIDASPDDFDRVVLAVFTEGELEAFERFLPLYFPRRGELDL